MDNSNDQKRPLILNHQRTELRSDAMENKKATVTWEEMDRLWEKNRQMMQTSMDKVVEKDYKKVASEVSQWKREIEEHFKVMNAFQTQILRLHMVMHDNLKTVVTTLNSFGEILREKVPHQIKPLRFQEDGSLVPSQLPTQRSDEVKIEANGGEMRSHSQDRSEKKEASMLSHDLKFTQISSKNDINRIAQLYVNGSADAQDIREQILRINSDESFNAIEESTMDCCLPVVISLLGEGIDSHTAHAVAILVEASRRWPTIFSQMKHRNLISNTVSVLNELIKTNPTPVYKGCDQTEVHQLVQFLNQCVEKNSIQATPMPSASY